jgi:hypothetical protein
MKGIDWICLAADRDHRQTLVSMIVDLRLTSIAQPLAPQEGLCSVYLVPVAYAAAVLHCVLTHILRSFE